MTVVTSTVPNSATTLLFSSTAPRLCTISLAALCGAERVNGHLRARSIPPVGGGDGESRIAFKPACEGGVSNVPADGCTGEMLAFNGFGAPWMANHGAGLSLDAGSHRARSEGGGRGGGAAVQPCIGWQELGEIPECIRYPPGL